MPKVGHRSFEQERSYETTLSLWSHLDNDDDKPHVIRTTNPSSPRQSLVENPNGWYRIRIPTGSSYQESYYMVELRRALYPKKFTPYFWQSEARRVQFFVDDFEVAKKLNDANEAIIQPNNRSMQIVVDAQEPYYKLNDGVMEKMKKAIMSCYDTMLNELDLSEFFAHPMLRNNYCPLNRPAIIAACLEIIVEKIPHLDTLILDDNKIVKPQHLDDLKEKLPRLTTLSLAHNLITNYHALDFIQTSNIAVLRVTGNPIQQNFRNDIDFFNAMRRRFPKLQNVDGLTLPAKIGFDVAEMPIPSPKHHYFGFPNAQAFGEAFINNFFTLYDSGNREQLKNYYAVDAYFSLTTASNVPGSSNYEYENRDLLHFKKTEWRTSRLFKGNEEIVLIFSTFPDSVHDYSSFCVDLTYADARKALITVTGIFCEKDENGKLRKDSVHMHAFHRSFVTWNIPDTSTHVIVNDMLHINCLTPKQQQQQQQAAMPIDAVRTQQATANFDAIDTIRTKQRKHSNVIEMESMEFDTWLTDRSEM